MERPTNQESVMYMVENQTNGIDIAAYGRYTKGRGQFSMARFKMLTILMT